MSIASKGHSREAETRFDMRHRLLKSRPPTPFVNVGRAGLTLAIWKASKE